MGKRILLVGCLVVLLTAVGCSSSSSNKKAVGSGGSSAKKGGAETVKVMVDAKATATSAAFTSYFPKEVTVHPGDSVDFAEVFTGEPHTVTLGTLVDQGLPKVDPKADTEPAELQKIPHLLPNGPGDAVQAVAQPCFLAAGDPPQSAACTKDQQKAVPFTGTETFVNSGFLTDGQVFKLDLAKDIKPGTYSFFCSLHRAGMMGKITVVASGSTAQTAADVLKAGNMELAAAQAKIKPVVEAIKAGTLPPFVPTAAPGVVIAGGGAQDQLAAVPVLFGPSKASIKVGQAVTWTVVGPHTISFGASEALRTFISRAQDGSVHLNPDAGKPAGGAGQPQQAGPPPSGPPGPPTPIDGGAYAGTGFHSSGFIGSFPPNLFTYKLTFTKAGSFEYHCLVHPDMKGVVNVT